MRDYYDQIFKRKSFHHFTDIGKITEEELSRLRSFIDGASPLDGDIAVSVDIVPQSETTCNRGAEYCIVFYSEKKGNYLHNIGYIGEQVDLYLSSVGIGALWFGMGKPKKAQKDGLDYVIMIAVAKMSEERFREDMFAEKRKPLSETWRGETLGVADIARFAPSACNSQPWLTENEGGVLSIYRTLTRGGLSVMTAEKAAYFNRIDVGIYLLILETCLMHVGLSFDKTIFDDTNGTPDGKALVARYRLASTVQ